MLLGSIQFKTLQSSHWKRDRLHEVLGSIAGKRIIVVGDVGIDRYTFGSVERISPEAPVPIVLVKEEKLKLGLAANVADNIQILKGVPLLLGVVGRDRDADDLRDLLRMEKIQGSYLVEDSTRRTVLKERVIGERQQMLRIDYESSEKINETVENQVYEQFEKLVAEADGIIVEDYAKGLLSESLMNRITTRAQQLHKIIAVDPNSKAVAQLYRNVTVLTPNTKEAEQLSGLLIRDEESLGSAGFKILELTHAQHVIITRGMEGMALFTAHDPIVRLIPTCAREVYDVSGAGDTVISLLVLALVSGADLEEAAILSNLAAGVEVSKLGTATVSVDEIRTEMEGWMNHA